MKKSKAIRRLENLRRDVEEYIRNGGADDRVWAADIEALTAGIEALSARDPDRTGRLRRDSEMLARVLAAVTAVTYAESERPMFDAIVSYWRQGRRADSPIERIALDDYRKECHYRVRPNNLDGRREIICRVALLLLEDVYPETHTEAKTSEPAQR